MFLIVGYVVCCCVLQIPCPAGRFGSERGLTSQECSGPCANPLHCINEGYVLMIKVIIVVDTAVFDITMFCAWVAMTFTVLMFYVGQQNIPSPP